MHYFRSICRSVSFAVLTLCAWIAGETIVLAAGDEGVGGGDWVWGYSFVVLIVALSMVAVCKASRRRNEIHPPVYEEIKIVKKTLLHD
jgi:hypothetical protein